MRAKTYPSNKLDPVQHAEIFAEALLLKPKRKSLGFRSSVRDQRYRGAVAETILAAKPTLWITITFNSDGMHADPARQKIQMIFLRTQEMRFGKGRQLPEEFDRVQFLAEKVDVNYHVHSFWTPGRQGRLTIEEAFARAPWTKDHSEIKTHVVPLISDAAAYYSAKEQWTGADPDRWLFSEDLIPKSWIKTTA